MYHCAKSSDYLGYQSAARCRWANHPDLRSAGLYGGQRFSGAGHGCRRPGRALVPYTEYLLYRREDMTVALQNIGGIGNITVLPKGGSLDDTYAFDTGPGNMVMDELARASQRCAALRRGWPPGKAGNSFLGNCCISMLEDPYLKEPPPKSTGREVYGKAYVDRLVQIGQSWAFPLRNSGYGDQVHRGNHPCGNRALLRPVPDRLIVGGGGSMNPS